MYINTGQNGLLMFVRTYTDKHGPHRGKECFYVRPENRQFLVRFAAIQLCVGTYSQHVRSMFADCPHQRTSCSWLPHVAVLRNIFHSLYRPLHADIYDLSIACTILDVEHVAQDFWDNTHMSKTKFGRLKRGTKNCSQQAGSGTFNMLFRVEHWKTQVLTYTIFYPGF